jgi:hypothetical protein
MLCLFPREWTGSNTEAGSTFKVMRGSRIPRAFLSCVFRDDRPGGNPGIHRLHNRWAAKLDPLDPSLSGLARADAAIVRSGLLGKPAIGGSGLVFPAAAVLMPFGYPARVTPR